MDDHSRGINPLAPPDWRFRPAQELVAAGKLASPQHDVATRRAVDYLRACRSRPGHVHLTGDLAEIHVAHSIWLDTDAVTKYAIEAYLISGADVPEVATELGITSSCVRWYESLFF